MKMTGLIEFTATSRKRAISLKNPWPHLILNPYFGKDVENRRRPIISPKNFDTTIWLHASSTMSDRDYDFAYEYTRKLGYPAERFPTLSQLVFGGIVGKCRVVDVILPGGIQESGGRHPRAGAKWHMSDQYGYILTNVTSVPFVACRGSLGLWPIPPDICEQLGPA